MMLLKTLAAALVIFMLSSLCKVFGMERGPLRDQYLPRQVQLSENRFHFVMPEDFSRDMPADDLIEQLNIQDLSLFENPENGNLIRRWWDIKGTGFFAKKLGTVMMDIRAVRLPENTRQLLHSRPYDIRNRLDFIMAIEEVQHNRYDELNAGLSSGDQEEFSYGISSVAILLGDKLLTSYRDHIYNHQKWTGYSVKGPQDQLLVCLALPINSQVFLEVVFTYSPNKGVLPRAFLAEAYKKTKPIEESFLVEFGSANPLESVVGEKWLHTETNDTVASHRDVLIPALYGKKVASELEQKKTN